MAEILDFEETKTEETKTKKKDPITLDYILAVPAGIAAGIMTKRIFNDICNVYKHGSIIRLGGSMVSILLAEAAYADSVKMIQAIRESIVKSIDSVREEMHGDC